MDADTPREEDTPPVQTDAPMGDAAAASSAKSVAEDDDDGDGDDRRESRAENERGDGNAGDGPRTVETRVVAPGIEKVPRVIVDRTKVCPFLLRVFPKENEFNRMDELARARLPVNELQIYTWMSETLRTLTQLIKSQLPSFRAKDTQFVFNAAYPDNRGNYTMRELGMTQGGRKGNDDQLSLADLNFKIGDYIMVKVVMGRDAGPRRADFRGGRDGPRMDRGPGRDGPRGRMGDRLGERDRDRPRDRDYRR